MPIDPVQEFIPRKIPEPIKIILDKYGDAIDEWVNFGSHIVDWDKGVDWVDGAIIMQFRNYLELLDAISILVRTSAVAPSKLELRGALESFFTLLFLLQDNSRQKAIAFITQDILEQITVLERLKKSNKSPITGSDSRSFQDHIDGRIRILKSDEFRDTYNFFQTKMKNGKYPNKWYQVFGISTIKGIAQKVGKEDLYNILYSALSANTHGTDVISGKITRASDGYGEIIQLRSWENATTVVRLSISITRMLFDEYVGKRIPSRQKNYSDWYSSVSDTMKSLWNQTDVL